MNGNMAEYSQGSHSFLLQPDFNSIVKIPTSVATTMVLKCSAESTTFIFRLRIKTWSLYPQVCIYGQRLQRKEFLDTKPHTGENKETRKEDLRQRKKEY
jgi:hypothetical protein